MSAQTSSPSLADPMRERHESQTDIRSFGEAKGWSGNAERTSLAIGTTTSASTRGASHICLPVNPLVTAQADPPPFPTELSETLEEIRSLRELSSGWNGYDVAAPSFAAVENAASWAEDMYKDVTVTHREWRKPHVAPDENGDVTLEWWNGDKGLTVYISGSEAIYIKDWGPDVINEMEDGTAETQESRLEMWSWLID